MPEPEGIYFEILTRIAELEVLAKASEQSNTRWRGQQRHGGPIDLDILEGDAWKTYFRFSKDEVYRLATCLKIPDKIQSDNFIFEDKITALCMLLAQLACPNHLSDLHLKFGRKPERVSRTVNTLLRFIYDTWKHLLVFDFQRLTPQKLYLFTRVIQATDAPYAKAPDGTSLQIYGDPAYGISEHLITPFQGAAITEDEQLWNRSMSKVRIVVE
ncbi:uncharacterized protein H6S33_003765 [Morchella sextelata]|uniref:uncharacterized protein n=1 Tax=Morchella sextelata TaxID=1174677 RepID=UPI001D0597E1|nr:uncharacterized protein H6S33_003765 [Morchella sextelata]KAH0606104.1 hypothetical protein H6S33_003765 [Morchella sextelata]